MQLDMIIDTEICTNINVILLNKLEVSIDMLLISDLFLYFDYVCK